MAHRRPRYPKPAGRAGYSLVTPTAQKRVRDRPDVKARVLLDLSMRFEDMRTLQVDVQVVYPTLFLAYLTHDAAYEVELCKAYNRFLADVWAKAEDKIRWVVIPPLRDIDASIAEVRFGKEHDACGVFFRGIEGDRTLDDPYFFPVYEEAQSLGLPICIHQGQGAPALNNLVDIKRSPAFTHGRLPPVVAFRNLVANRVPEDFPTLRWGFIETGASWVPFAMYQLRGTLRAPDDFWGPKLFDQYNMWISYEVGEDLPYLLKYIGEDHMVAGTDYGHHAPGTTDRLSSDPSAQVHLVPQMRSREDVPSSVAEKILTDNSTALYSI